MKKVSLLIVFLTVLVGLNATTLFVKQGSNGDGSSWANAFNSLQEALEVATEGTEIWVAAGKYTPTKTTNRTVSFHIKDGVKVYGGFAGHETSLAQRNVEKNKTILSGEIATPALNDNSFTVIYTENVSANTIVDGFTITGGMANNQTKGNAKECAGAGWYNNGANGVSTPTIANCTFINNIARNGAALYNNATRGEASPILLACQFISNQADLDGGAIYNNGEQGTSNPTITDCTFKDNQATYGGAILNNAKNGTCNPEFKSCIFAENNALIKGAGYYNTGDCQPTFIACNEFNSKSSIGSNSSIQSSNAGTGKMQFSINRP